MHASGNTECAKTRQTHRSKDNKRDIDHVMHVMYVAVDVDVDVDGSHDMTCAIINLPFVFIDDKND